MASGNSLYTFYPNDNEAPSSNPATKDYRNGHPVLDFDTTTQEFAIFSGVMPQHYAGTTGVTVYVHWSATSATTGTIGWEISFEKIGNEIQGLDTDSFASPNTVTASNVPDVAGDQDFVKVTSVNFTDGADMDSVVAGDLFRLKLARDVANDTAAGDGEVHAIEIRET